MYRNQTRRRLRGVLLLLTLLGLLSLGYGIAAPTLDPVAEPRPVIVGQPAALPSSGHFGGTLALYGSPDQNGDSQPTETELGCILHRGNGKTTTRGLSTAQARNLERRVIDDHAVLPLLAITGSSARMITCNGTASLDAQPLFLIATPGQRDLVPMAAFSFATLALVLGVAGLIALRPTD